MDALYRNRAVVIFIIGLVFSSGAWAETVEFRSRQSIKVVSDLSLKSDVAVETLEAAIAQSLSNHPVFRSVTVIGRKHRRNLKGSDWERKEYDVFLAAQFSDEALPEALLTLKRTEEKTIFSGYDSESDWDYEWELTRPVVFYFDYKDRFKRSFDCSFVSLKVSIANDEIESRFSITNPSFEDWLKMVLTPIPPQVSIAARPILTAMGFFFSSIHKHLKKEL